MDPYDIREKRTALGLTQGQASRLFRLKSSRTWRRWEAGDQPISAPAGLLLSVVSTVPAAWRKLLALNGLDQSDKLPSTDDDAGES